MILKMMMRTVRMRMRMMVIDDGEREEEEVERGRRIFQSGLTRKIYHRAKYVST